MKTLIIAFGFAEYCIPLANGLSNSIQTVFMYGSKGPSANFTSLSPKVTLKEFMEPRLRHLGSQIKCMLQLVANVRKLKPDVVHLQHGHLWFNLIALPLLKRYPIVYTIHDVVPHPGDKLSAKTPYWVQRIGFNQADQVIVHGNYLKALAEAELGLPPARVNSVPMVANVSVPLASQAADTKGIKNILFFGRIYEYKGLRYLIEAEPLITAQCPEAHIVIAGTGDDFARYQRKMVNPRHFTVHNRFIPAEETTPLFNDAAIVALPYIEASQSGVVQIAYRFGKPVVATQVGGLPDVVDDGQTGLLVPPRDPQALAAAIVKLLKDDNLRAQMGHNGRLKMESDFSPNAVADLTVQVYQKAIATKHNIAA